MLKDGSSEGEIKEVGVHVNLPLLNDEDRQGGGQKTRFYTGFVDFGTFMVIFNTLSTLTGRLKLLEWKGFL